MALQVNTWNENRKDDQNLRETLVALKEEVAYNANFLEFLTEERTRKEQEYTNYLDIITDKSKSVAERAQYELPDWFARKHGKGWRAKYEEWKYNHKSGELPWLEEAPETDKAANKIERIRAKGVPPREEIKREQDYEQDKQLKKEKQ